MAKMSFLRRVAGLSVRDRVRSSDIQQRLRVEPRTHWGDYISRLAREHLIVPLQELVDVAREKNFWISLLKLFPL